MQRKPMPSCPPDKKRKLNTMELRSRDTPSVKVNGKHSLPMPAGVATAVKQPSEEPATSAVTNGNEENQEAMMSRTEIETLINMKMQGKAKHDQKGRIDQLMDYIKRLRNCARQLLHTETICKEENERLLKQMEEKRRRQEEIESTFKQESMKLQDEIAELKSRYSCLEKELQTAKDKIEELLATHEKDLEALTAAGTTEQKLSEEIEKLKKDLSDSCDQIKSLQDTNRRLTEYNTSLQVYNTKLQTDVSSLVDEISKVKQEKAAIFETLSSLRGNYSALQNQLENNKESLLENSKQKNALSEEKERLYTELLILREERDRCLSQIQSLTEENEKFKEFTGKSVNEVRELTLKASSLEEKFAVREEHLNSLQKQVLDANEKLKVADRALIVQKEEKDQCLLRTIELQERLSQAERQLNEGELLRRKLHNTIQELKGNIRVFCRVRPLLPDDRESGSDIPIVEYPTSTELQGRGIELIQPQQGQKYVFSFDKVFGPEVTQGDIFVDISQLVQSALDGYKVCIFAYGQTGSGKTHTMLGQPEDAYNKGLIPRSLEQIFKSSEALRTQGWNFKMQASMLEIYNETIRDLAATRTAFNDSTKQHTIRHDANGNACVSDLTIVEVTNWDEVSSLLNRAAQCRAMGKTAMNEQSSRSHCVFTLRIAGVNVNTEQHVHGILNLVDLAGSERLSKSCAVGERLKETQAINKSLSSLGDVILAIANKDPHVPFRNSKLTYLLQPCLGGDSKTLMFVNISPEPKSFNESLCSLRFAAKVNSCEIGIPRRHTQSRMSDATSKSTC